MNGRKLSQMFASLFSSTSQVKRIVILSGFLLVLLVASFGAYYYSDRYGSPVKGASANEKNVVELEEQVRQNPQNVDLRLALAESYLTAENYEGAIVQSQEIIKISPDNDGAYFILGLAYTSLKQYEQALPPLTKYVEVREESEMANADQSLETALYFLGEGYLQIGRPDEAIRSLTRALEINKTDADAMYKLGLAYSKSGQYEQSLTYYEKSVMFVPDFSEAYSGMAESFDMLGEVNKAAYARGMLAYSVGDYETARIEMERIAIQMPDYAPVFIGLALVYEKVGDLEKARTSVEAALMIEPENLSAQQTLGRIQAAMTK